MVVIWKMHLRWSFLILLGAVLLAASSVHEEEPVLAENITGNATESRQKGPPGGSPGDTQNPTVTGPYIAALVVIAFVIGALVSAPICVAIVGAKRDQLEEEVNKLREAIESIV